MNHSKPENNPGSGSASQPVAPPQVSYDLGAMLKENPRLYHVLRVTTASTSYLGLGLRAHVSFGFGHLSQFVLIDCVNAVDFSIRPPNGATLMGGPPMEFYEQHPRLENISQTVPNTDGMEVFTPPVKFTLLVMDQSHIIAQRFVLRIEDGDIFKDAIGMDENRKQRQAEDLKRGLDWMEKFRMPALQK
jgi:hypothetical protein